MQIEKHLIKESKKKVKTEQCWAIKWVLEQLKKAQGKGKAIQKSSGQEEEEEKEKEKVGTRIRLGLKPWGELIISDSMEVNWV